MPWFSPVLRGFTPGGGPCSSLGLRRAASGKDDDLRAEHQSGAEADLKGESATQLRVLLELAMRRERDRGRRGVPGRLDVASDEHRLGKVKLLGEFVDDPHVRL